MVDISSTNETEEEEEKMKVYGILAIRYQQRR